MTSLLAAVVLVSLLGSLHCAGMCGPIVVFATSSHPRLTPNTRTLAAAQAFYHAGRLLAYAAIGALFGALGQALNHGGKFAGLQNLAAWLTGGTIVLVGLLSLLPLKNAIGHRNWVVRNITAALAAGHRKALAMPPLVRASTIGVLSGIAPCGWLYSFALLAAGTGSAFSGALLMTAFWAGTVPILTAIGLIADKTRVRLGTRLQAVVSLGVVALGLWTLTGRLEFGSTLSSLAISTPANAAPSELAERVAELRDETPACCRSKDD